MSPRPCNCHPLAALQSSVCQLVPSLNTSGRRPMLMRLERWMCSKLCAMTARTPRSFVPLAAESREEPVPYSRPRTRPVDSRPYSASPRQRSAAARRTAARCKAALMTSPASLSSRCSPPCRSRSSWASTTGSSGLAVDERRQQQHGADRRHFRNSVRPDEPVVDAHDERDRHGGEHRKGAPGSP